MFRKIYHICIHSYTRILLHQLWPGRQPPHPVRHTVQLNLKLQFYILVRGHKMLYPPNRRRVHPPRYQSTGPKGEGNLSEEENIGLCGYPCAGDVG